MISHLRIKHRKCSRLPCKLVPDWGKQSGHYLFPLLLATLCIKRKRFHNNFPHPFHPIMVYLVANITYPPVRELLLFAGWEKISKDGVAGKNSSRVYAGDAVGDLVAFYDSIIFNIRNNGRAKQLE